MIQLINVHPGALWFNTGARNWVHRWLQILSHKLLQFVSLGMQILNPITLHMPLKFIYLYQRWAPVTFLID